MTRPKILDLIDFHYSARGVTRHVVLVGPWAIKLPRLNHGWKGFLVGLMCNMQEAEFWTLNDPRLCPVLWSVAGGWLVVMRRARVMTQAEFSRLDWPRFVMAQGGRAQVPAEPKADSFGWIDGRVVAIDYGSA